MPKFFITFFIICFSFTINAQQKVLDSLLAIPENTLSNDSIKTKHFVKIFVAYNKVPDFQKVEEYAQKALNTSKNLKNSNIYLNVYERLGMCYHGNSKYLQAEHTYLEGIEKAKSLGNEVKVANFYLNLGALYSTVADYNKALETNKLALDIYRKTGNFENMNSCYMNIGDIYLYLQQPIKAIEYINKANAAFVKEGNGINYGVYSANHGLAVAYLNLSTTDLNKLELTTSQQMALVYKYLNTALEVAEKMEDKSSVGKIHNQIGEAFSQFNDSKKALFHFNLALKIAQELKVDEDLSNVNLAFGSHYLKNNDLEKSKQYLNQSLEISKRINLLSDQKDAFEKLSDVAQKMGDYKTAFEMHKQFIETKELILNQEKEKEITRKQLKIDFEIKENDYKIKQQFDEKIKWILGISAAILLALTLVIYLNQRKTQKLNSVISKQKLELEQLGIVKDKMFSLVSHDMRSPVNALISFITLLENRQISQEKLGLYAGELKNQLTQTSTLMENMLNWAASQMQGFSPNMVVIDLFKVSESVLQNMQPLAAAKGIAIINNIHPDTLAKVDTEMLSLIIRNLVANAIKFCKQNGTIELNCKAEKDKILLSVKDDGVGISADKIKQINDPESTLINTTTGTQREKGTGMGLMLCKTFAKLINGKLTAQSTENEGSEFVLELEKA